MAGTLVAVLVLGWTLADARPRAYLGGLVAGAIGDRPAAFDLLANAWHLDPGFLDIDARTAAAADQLTVELPLDDLALEVRLLRWLAASSRVDELAAALDRSRVLIRGGSSVLGERAGGLPVEAFMIGRYEITNAQYRRFASETGRLPPDHWPDQREALDAWADRPVVGVSWEDACAFCSWAGGRLPTEDEWERACRGRDGGIYPWGDDWLHPATVGRASPSQGRPISEAEAWAMLTSGDSDLGPLPVGSAQGAASPYGVQDLVGGVSEWVAGWYEPEQWNHPVRGSSWLDRFGRDDWLAADSRCSARDGSHSVSVPDFGFRCAFDPDQAKGIGSRWADR